MNCVAANTVRRALVDQMDAVMDDTPVKPAGTPSLRLVDEQQSPDWQEPALDSRTQSPRLRFGELNRHEQEDLAGILLSMMRELKELRVTAASLEEKPRKRGRKKADYKRKGNGFKTGTIRDTADQSL